MSRFFACMRHKNCWTASGLFFFSFAWRAITNYSLVTSFAKTSHQSLIFDCAPHKRRARMQSQPTSNPGSLSFSFLLLSTTSGEKEREPGFEVDAVQRILCRSPLNFSEIACKTGSRPQLFSKLMLSSINHYLGK